MGDLADESEATSLLGLLQTGNDEHQEVLVGESWDGHSEENRECWQLKRGKGRTRSSGGKR
jgi:hypothetical protein